MADPTHTSPALPGGHPFSNVQPYYWSATTDASDASKVWVFFLLHGEVGYGLAKDNNLGYRWCVRGGSGPDPQ